MKFNNLPQNWSLVKLETICKTKSGGTPSRKNKSYFDGSIPWLKSGELNYQTIFDSDEKITEEALNHSSAVLFPKGTLLIALYGATVGRLAFLGIEAATNQAIAGLFPDENLLKKYLYWYLINIHRKLMKLRIGGAQPNISQGTLKSLEIPLPPLPEQQAIVQKIEELFSDLDKGVESLKQAKEQIKIYRQAVLKAAFEGKLTDEKIGEDGLPQGWEYKSFVDFCKLQRGYDLPLRNIIEGEYPVVTSSGVKGYHNDYKAEGPILVTGRSGSVGSTHYMDTKKYWPHNTVLFAKDFCGNYPKFIYYYFLQFNFKSFSASTAVPTLDRKQLYNEKISVPDVETQTQIVQEIETRFSEADNLEKSIDESLSHSESLRQSILKQAFEGRLV